MRSALSTVQPLSTDTSLIWTPLYHGQFPMSQQNSHIFAIKQKTSIIWTLSNTDTDTKSWPQRVNSYKLNLFIMETAEIRRIPHPESRSGESAQGESCLVWLMSHAR